MFVFACGAFGCLENAKSNTTLQRWGREKLGSHAALSARACPLLVREAAPLARPILARLERGGNKSHEGAFFQGVQGR